MAVLRLESCENCTILPPLGLLRSLKDLTIQGMNALKSIGFEIYGDDYSNAFPSLETLIVEKMPEWESWELIPEVEFFRSFPCLQELSISDCPKFTGRLPDHLSSLKKLAILECSQLVVSFSHLPSLEKLMIQECAALEIFFSCVPCLHELEIHGCKKMACGSPVDFQQIMSVKLSNISYLKNALFHKFQEYTIAKVSGCEEFFDLWENQRYTKNPPYGLYSFPSLNELHVENCPGLISFSETNLFSHLTKLVIVNCGDLKSLPEEMKHSNSILESLRIEGCHALSCILRGQLPASLKQLVVTNCKELLCLLDDREDTCAAPSSYSMKYTEIIKSSRTSLENLYVSYCPSLTCLSSSGELPASLRQLDIQDCSVITILSATGSLPVALKHINVTNCPKLESIAKSSTNILFLESMLIRGCRTLISISGSLQNFVRLQEIYLLDCPTVVSFPEVGLHSRSLKVLSIMRCRRISALPNSMHRLDSLRQLVLKQCPRIVSFPEGGFPTNITSLSVADLNIRKPLFEWGFYRFTSLKVLEIRGCHEATSFPQEEMGMMLPDSVTQLTIQGFSNLTCLSSSGFQNLTSLENLSISDCPKLISFPTEGFSSSLLQLFVSRCPLLEERCKRKGTEWLKIAHVPRIRIGC